jgi:hypothetical protein
VDYPLQSALHPVSASSSDTVTLAPLESGAYSLVHIDWDTGKEVGSVILGANPIFNTTGGFIIPLNENETYISGVFGPVRISRHAE